MKKKKIFILVDNDSWIIPYANVLKNKLELLGYPTNLIRDSKEIREGWINFILGCTKIIGSDCLKKNQHNLVVHESDLPQGRGFAPMAWQIIEGKGVIPICLIEADSEVDSGDIWIKDEIKLNGTELSNEWRDLQGQKTVDLCYRFVTNYEKLRPTAQLGEGSYYKRRKPVDSKLDIKKSVEEQFNLLRVVDNEKYPAFFELHGKQYILKIEGVDVISK